MMRKIVLLTLIVSASAACKKDEATRYRDAEGSWDTPPSVRYYHDARADKCFFRAADWRLTSGSHGPVLTLHETACTDALKTVAETIGGAEAPAQTKTVP